MFNRAYFHYDQHGNTSSGSRPLQILRGRCTVRYGILQRRMLLERSGSDEKGEERQHQIRCLDYRQRGCYRHYRHSDLIQIFLNAFFTSATLCTLTISAPFFEVINEAAAVASSFPSSGNPNERKLFLDGPISTGYPSEK